MSFATDGDTEHLGPVNRRKPISVAQLLEREGFQPAMRSRATRRALTGVAAGAVLALGAVVGSLLLNHGAQNTNGDTLASGSQSGGDIVLAENGQTGSAAAPSTAVQVSAPAGSSTQDGNSTRIVQNGSTGKITIQARTSTATQQATTNTGTAKGTTSGGTSTAAPAPTSSAPTSTAAAGAGTSTSTPQSPPTSTATAPGNGNASATASKAATTSSSTTSGNGGLVGTVTGTLSSVTDPLFNWFSS